MFEVIGHCSISDHDQADKSRASEPRCHLIAASLIKPLTQHLRSAGLRGHGIQTVQIAATKKRLASVRLKRSIRPLQVNAD